MKRIQTIATQAVVVLLSSFNIVVAEFWSSKDLPDVSIPDNGGASENYACMTIPLSGTPAGAKIYRVKMRGLPLHPHKGELRMPYDKVGNVSAESTYPVVRAVGGFEVATSFRPSSHGYRFPNFGGNTLITIPVLDIDVPSVGNCYAFSARSVDYFEYGTPIPQNTTCWLTQSNDLVARQLDLAYELPYVAQQMAVAVLWDTMSGDFAWLKSKLQAGHPWPIFLGGPPISYSGFGPFPLVHVVVAYRVVENYQGQLGKHAILVYDSNQPTNDSVVALYEPASRTLTLSSGGYTFNWFTTARSYVPQAPIDAPPSLEVSRPVDGQVLHGPAATQIMRVEGFAHDDIGITAVTVNGQSATIVPAGGGIDITWSRDVILVEGLNPIICAAQDTASHTITQTVSVEYHQQQLKGRLEVDSSPRGAAVQIRGFVYVDPPVTPCWFDLDPGIYIVDVSYPGAEVRTLQVIVESGKTKSLFAVFLLPSPGLSITLNEGKPVLKVAGRVGVQYIIEYVSAVPATGNWLPLSSFLLTNNPQSLIDTMVTGKSNRFYRVRSGL